MEPATWWALSTTIRAASTSYGASRNIADTYVATARTSTSVSISARASVATVGLALASMIAGCGEGHGKHGHPPPAISVGASTAPRPQPSSDTSKVIRSVDRNQRDHFALLREGPEPLLPSIRRILRKPTYGMNWDLAQRVPLSLQGSFWLVPGRHTLCLLHAETLHDVSSACATTKVALNHGVVTVSLREATAGAPAERLIVGVVPDGISEVVVHTRRVASRVAVVDHVFVRRDAINEPPDLVSLN